MRNRPKEHKRILRTNKGRKIVIVNRGVKKRKRNYSFVSFNSGEMLKLRKQKLRGEGLTWKESDRLARISLEMDKNYIKAKKERELKNYNFFKSVNWKEMSAEAKRRREDDLGIPVRDPETRQISFVENSLKPKDIFLFVDLDKGLSELESKGAKMDRAQKDEIINHVRRLDYDRAYELLPRLGKIDASLATANAESIYAIEREKIPKVARPLRIKRF